MIIDSHCHLNYEPMSLSLNETIDRANKDGVKYMLTICTEDKSFDKYIKNYIKQQLCVWYHMEYTHMKQKIIKIINRRYN